MLGAHKEIVNDQRPSQNTPAITNASSDIDAAQDSLWQQPVFSTTTIHEYIS